MSLAEAPTWHEERGTEPDNVKQAALLLELAEHHYLRTLGWTFGQVNDVFVWTAPASHRGSSRHYATRAHAINSVKRWMHSGRYLPPSATRRVNAYLLT